MEQAPRVPAIRRCARAPSCGELRSLRYDPETLTLHVGDGAIAPVDPSVVAYEVGGTNVLRKWFGYRRATRPQARGEQSPLDDIRPTSWPSAYTTDLLELLHVLTLVVELEPQQADLLAQVMTRPRVTVADLTGAAVLPVPASARAPFSKKGAPKVAVGFEQGTLDD